jgi:hypothetical protein
MAFLPWLISRTLARLDARKFASTLLDRTIAWRILSQELATKECQMAGIALNWRRTDWNLDVKSGTYVTGLRDDSHAHLLQTRYIDSDWTDRVIQRLDTAIRKAQANRTGQPGSRLVRLQGVAARVDWRLRSTAATAEWRCAGTSLLTQVCCFDC